MNLKTFLRSILCIITVVSFVACTNNNTQHETRNNPLTSLRQTLLDTISKYKASIGMAVLDLQSGDTLTIHNDSAYAMQSVYKLPLCMLVMKQVEEGKLQLQQRVNVNPDLADLFNWSPFKLQNPDNYLKASIDSLIMYTLAYSDNLTCDQLFEVVGGTQVVDQFWQTKGFKDMHIKKLESEIGDDANNMYKNTTTPLNMCKVLQALHNNSIISKKSGDYLLNYMRNDSTSHKRLLGQLPGNMAMAHKTGSGLKVCNDVGILYLPNNKQVAISVFIMHSQLEYESAEQVISSLGKAVAEHYQGQLHTK